MPQQPSSPSFLSCAEGNFSARSYSRTMGRISVSMNWRTVSRMRIWSLLSEKSIARCRKDASTVRSSKAALMNRENLEGDKGKQRMEKRNGCANREVERHHRWMPMNTAQGNGNGDIETRVCGNHGRGRSDSSHRA